VVDVALTLNRLLVSAPDVKTGGSNWAWAALAQQAATARAIVLLRKDMSGDAPETLVTQTVRMHRNGD
jgi:hypothetical protein